MSARRLLQILTEDGWEEAEQDSNHIHLVHPRKEGKVILPIHKRDIPKGTVRAILRRAGLR